MLSGSPPLTRGIRYTASSISDTIRITPAYAGNTPSSPLMGLPKRDHPRLRGEYGSKVTDMILDEGSPPLTRGILYDRPALMATYRDHPRLRGEYMYAILNTKTKKGSPPLTRGIHIGLADENKIVGITPAYAGNTMGCIRSCLTRWDHPRLRGEYPDTRKKCSFSPGSPPLTRGIHDGVNVNG